MEHEIEEEVVEMSNVATVEQMRVKIIKARLRVEKATE